jgi:hypothetical protein
MTKDMQTKSQHLARMPVWLIDGKSMKRSGTMSRCWNALRLSALLLLAGACSSSSSSNNAPTNPCDAGLCTDFNPGFNARTSIPNSIGVTFSGETLGISGLPFCPANAGDPNFVDGWNMTFSEYLFVVANVRLNNDPLENQTWQDMGSQVAIKPGPYVIDAHRASGFVGKDGVEPASGLFIWTQLDNGQPFNTAVRYAFSYDVVTASYPATSVNLTQAEDSDYALMVQYGWSKFIRGTATYVGTGTYPDSTAQALFAALPVTVNFAFGWNDATQMLNCVNYDFSSSEDNLADRGVQTNPDGTYIAQITMHTDHTFWDKLRQEGANLRFDHVAAFAPTDGGTLWINNSTQKIQTTFANGVTSLPDRAPYQAQTGCSNAPPPFTCTSDPDDVGCSQVVLNLNGTTGLTNSLPVFMAFSAQSQSHLNAQGLCYVVGQHANDPYFSPVIQQVPSN